MEGLIRENKLSKDIMITFKADIAKLKKLVKKQYETIDSLSVSLDASKKDRKRLTKEAKEATAAVQLLKMQLEKSEESFELSLIKLRQEMQSAEVYRNEIDELRSAVHNLEIRASSNFAEMTPRPMVLPVSPRQLFEALSEPYKKMSTVEAVEIITDRLMTSKLTPERRTRRNTKTERKPTNVLENPPTVSSSGLSN
jgi:chromosome segregation ATPase